MKRFFILLMLATICIKSFSQDHAELTFPYMTPNEYANFLLKQNLVKIDTLKFDNLLYKIIKSTYGVSEKNPYYDISVENLKNKKHWDVMQFKNGKRLHRNMFIYYFTRQNYRQLERVLFETFSKEQLREFYKNQKMVNLKVRGSDGLIDEVGFQITNHPVYRNITIETYHRMEEAVKRHFKVNGCNLSQNSMDCKAIEALAWYEFDIYLPSRAERMKYYPRLRRALGIKKSEVVFKEFHPTSEEFLKRIEDKEKAMIKEYKSQNRRN